MPDEFNVEATSRTACTAAEPQWWHAPWRFGVHAIVGVCIFAVIAGAAMALDLAVCVLEARGVATMIVWGLRLAEYALFLADLVLFLVFIWRTAQRTLTVL